MLLKIFPITFALLTAFAWSSFSVADEPFTIASVDDSGPIPYKFKAKTLEDRVAEAIRQSKESDSQPLLQLMAEFATEPDKVLKLLRPYLNATDVEVQSSLVEAAGSAPQSEEALRMLVHLLPSEAGNYAAETLYRNYTVEELIGRGGTILKSALLRSAALNRDATHTYLLLSCYKSDEKIIQFLQKRRLTFKPAKDDAHQSYSTVSRIMPLDLALMELGDTVAQERVTQAFAKGEPKEVLSLLRYLKFVNNKAVLTAAIAQLQNKKVAQVFSSVDGKTATLVRVCDKALPVLRRRFLPPIKEPIKPPYPVLDPTKIYPDAELLDANNKFLALLNSKP